MTQVKVCLPKHEAIATFRRERYNRAK